MCCYNNSNPYGAVCRPEIPYPQISAESAPSLINNLATALYGNFFPTASIPNPPNSKSIVNGQVVWNVACDPSNTATILGVPRNAGEGFLCYLIRVFNSTYPTTLVGGTTGNVVYQSSASHTAFLANGASGTVLSSNGIGSLPSWVDPTTFSASTATNLSGGSSGTLVYQSFPGQTSYLPLATDGNILQQVSGVPTWVDQTASPFSVYLSQYATNIANGASGKIPYQVSSGITAFTASGTTGQVLVSGGTGSPTWTSSAVKAYGNVASGGTLVASSFYPTSGLTISTQTSGVCTITYSGISSTSKVLVTQTSGAGYGALVTLGSGSCTVTTYTGATATNNSFSFIIF